MAGLVPAIHDFLFYSPTNKTWMPGSSPGMTAESAAGPRSFEARAARGQLRMSLIVTRPQRRRLLAPQVRRLDNRPPFFLFRLLISAERRGGLLIGGHDFLADVGEPLLHRRIGERLPHRGIDFGNHIRRRAVRHPKPVPERAVETGQPGLVHARDIGDGGRAGAGRHRIGLTVPALICGTEFDN